MSVFPKISSDTEPSGRIAQRHLALPAALSIYSQRWYKILPSGKIVPGITFYYLSEELVHLIGSHDYRVVQCKRNKFYVEIVECNELPCKENDRLRKVFDKYLEPGLDVSYKCVDEIEKGSNGKYKVFVSLV